MIAQKLDLADADLRARAVAAARGDCGFDCLIQGGRIVDMVTLECRAADIGLVGGLIASVHAPKSRQDADCRLDAAGGFVTPGLIDMHMHVESSMVTPARYCDAVLARGVTSVVWDPHEFGNVHGMAGMEYAIAATRNLALRFFILAPSCVPSAPGFERAGADFDASIIEALLARSEVWGVAEVMAMREVIAGDPKLSAIVQAGLKAKKPVCGHARSLAGADLNAFIAAGISSDHELVSGEDLLEKLRAGLSIEMRGSHDYLLPEFVKTLNALGHLPQNVTLCTDDVFADDLFQYGGLDDVVRRLVRYGMRPEWALQAATLNAARRLGREDLGLIAPGRRADLVIFEDLRDLKARHVLVNGELVASHGQISQPSAEIDPRPLQHSVKVAPLCADDFTLRVNATRVRLATIDQPRFTKWGEVEAQVENGQVIVPDDATLIGVVHRHGKAEAKCQLGLLRGWGEWHGALATTVAHDSHNLTVFGRNPQDMAQAANLVIASGGGMAVVKEGQVLAHLPLPLSGLVSDAPLSDAAEAFVNLRKAMDQIVTWEPPYLTFKACFGATLACNAGPHQTDMGTADVVAGRLLTTPILEIIEECNRP